MSLFRVNTAGPSIDREFPSLDAALDHIDESLPLRRGQQREREIVERDGQTYGYARVVSSTGKRVTGAVAYALRD